MANWDDPNEVEKEMRKLIKEMGYAMHEYRWAFGVASSRQVVDTVHVSGGGYAKPHESDPEVLRNQALEVLGRHKGLKGALSEARSGMARITDNLRKAMATDESRHGGLWDSMALLATASKEDKQEAREAQIRRRGRGENIP